MEVLQGEMFSASKSTATPSFSIGTRHALPVVFIVLSTKVGIFLVVTNDGDFITPIQLIRQSGGYVHGFSDRGKAKNELARACDTFSFISCGVGTGYEIGNSLL
jgi:hypothetical protein